MIIDWTINIGTLITVISLLVGGIWAIASVRFDIRLIGARVERAEADLKIIVSEISQLTNVLVTIAKQEEQIKSLDYRLSMITSKCDRLHTFLPDGKQ